MTITEIWDEDTESFISLPCRWEICYQCHGEGTSSAYLGAFTADEMDEMGDDFLDGYRSGLYDRSCDVCEGSGKIRVVDQRRLSADLLQRYRYAEREEFEYEAMCATERMMGA